jgi:hypothetical protein
MLSGPLRNAVLLPLALGSTALPVPAQLVSADWMREVSGGVCSAVLLNCSLLVASVALSAVHVAGTLGWPGGGGGVVGVALGVGDGDAECDADGVGVGVGVADPLVADGDGAVPPLQAAPLRVNAVGSVFVAPDDPVKPIDTLAPVASAPFQLSLATVTFAPLWVQVPLQPLVTCWPLGKGKASVQDVVAEPRFVMVIPVWKPPGQLLDTAYATVHGALAAVAVADREVAASPAPTRPAAASTEREARNGRLERLGRFGAGVGSRIVVLTADGRWRHKKMAATLITAARGAHPAHRGR